MPRLGTKQWPSLRAKCRACRALWLPTCCSWRGLLPVFSSIEPWELDTLVLEVYRQARVMSDGLEVRLGHEDQAVIMGDADRLRQLLLNLVDNAIKYTPPGGDAIVSSIQRATVGTSGCRRRWHLDPQRDLEPGQNGLPDI